MKTLLEKLSTHVKLTEKEAYQFIVNINEEKFNSTQLIAAISFLIKRSVSVEELAGFKNALLDLSIKVNLDKEAIDVCGTGGDQKNTFNISTLCAIVLAASGVPVAKHGNQGASSVSGSSDILKYLGYKFKPTSEELNDELNEYNICFIHAPLFHPTLKHVANQRKELGIRTFFNLLGPLVNPAKVKHKYIGVYNQEVGRLYNYVLQKEGSKFTIVNSQDGYDEISLTGTFKTISNENEKIYEPIDLGFDPLPKEELFGGTAIKEAGRIFLNVLNNEATKAQTDVVLINSAFGMQIYFPGRSIQDCIAKCKETIESKKASQLFKNLISKN